MHVPKVFKEEDENKLLALIDAYPFATLTSVLDGKIEAMHLPIYVVKKNNNQLVAFGHIAKANRLWKKVESDHEVLVIFNGPESYISPNFYPSKKIDGKAVPTWNYVAVHLKGQLSVTHDKSTLVDILANLTSRHEKNFEQPWSMDDAPTDYIDKLTGAIVGLEIKATEMIGQSKLSQNHSEENQLGVVAGLKEQYWEVKNEKLKMAETINERIS